MLILLQGRIIVDAALFACGTSRCCVVGADHISGIFGDLLAALCGSSTPVRPTTTIAWRRTLLSRQKNPSNHPPRSGAGLVKTAFSGHGQV